MEPPKKRTPRKKKVGRPAFSRRDIPRAFFHYYEAYKFGFWNKQEFAFFLQVSRPTLDRYFKTIKAKPPVVSKAENKKLQKKMRIGDSLKEKVEFYFKLKEMNGEDGRKSTGVYGSASQAKFRLQIMRYNLKWREEHPFDDWD